MFISIRSMGKPAARSRGDIFEAPGSFLVQAEQEVHHGTITEASPLKSCKLSNTVRVSNWGTQS